MTKGLSILVAEDNEINALLARALLVRLGHRPTIAGNGEAAVEAWLAARAAGTPYDLVLMDVQMPVMDGLEATRRIRAAEAEAGAKPTRIVALTANASAEDREAALAAGMDGLLVKPLDRERLREALASSAAPARLRPNENFPQIVINRCQAHAVGIERQSSCRFASLKSSCRCRRTCAEQGPEIPMASRAKPQSAQPVRAGFARPKRRRSGAPNLISTLQAYGGLQAWAARAHRPSQSLGRLGSLEVRLAQTAAEVRQAQKLRYRVFYQEGSAIPNPGRLFARRDVDSYDAICDHLLVLDHAARAGIPATARRWSAPIGCCASRWPKTMAASTPPASSTSAG